MTIRYNLLLLLLIISIYNNSLSVLAISGTEEHCFHGDISIVPNSEKQGDIYIKFLQNNTDNVNMSKIHFNVKKDSNDPNSLIKICLSAEGRYLFAYSAELYIGGKQYSIGKLNEELCPDEGFPIRNEGSVPKIL